MIESHVIGLRASANIAPPSSAAHARMGAPSRALAELTEVLNHVYHGKTYSWSLKTETKYEI
jgi:hypothetical protein